MTAAPETRPAETTLAPMSGVVPYLNVDGAAKAAAFYKRAFGAEERGAIPPDERGRTMHIYLVINGGALMLSDFYPEHGFPKVDHQGYMLHLHVDDIDRWFARAVEAGATVTMPVHDAFWGDRYGQVTDPFGVSWGIGMTPKK